MKSSPVALLLVGLLGCGTGGGAAKVPAGSGAGFQAEDLAAARRAFVTKLRVRGPAPQDYTPMRPPAGVQEVTYPSGDLRLKGWLSAGGGGGQKRPAVVFLHGGFAFGDGDWEDAEPFAKAGFVLFVPTVRGENGNPGAHESFLAEADDAVAAGRYVAALPRVDPARVFVAGHSVGGVLTCLAAMLPSPYTAAAALDGSVDMPAWVAGAPASVMPYDTRDAGEVRLRNPLAFATSLKIPLRLYVGEAGQANGALARLARQAGKDCELVNVGGDHQGMVAPAVERAITWFRQVGGE